MSQDNQFHQYGYDHYLKAPARPGGMRYSQSLTSRIIEKVQNPVIAMGTLAFAGIIFVGVIAFTYPGNDDEQQQIPIVKADLRPMKVEPNDPGGMSIPYRDSAMLAQVGQPRYGQSSERVENLMRPDTEDQAVNKESAIERAMADAPRGGTEFIVTDTVRSAEAEEEMGIEVLSLNVNGEDAPEASALTSVPETVEEDVADVKPDFELKEPSANDLLQKIGSSESEENEEPSGFSQKVADVATSQKPDRPQMHAAATSPETIEFVRGILDEGNDKPSQASHSQQKAVEDSYVSAESLSQIEPSLGAAGSDPVYTTTGSYFVQLASITDASRAVSEWSKMEAKYAALKGAKFRVQRAELSNGTFYRIQAGPMSKEQANSMCESLKASSKPGGCLVVK